MRWDAPRMENRNTEGAERDPPHDAAAAIEDLPGFELHDDITERTIDHVKIGYHGRNQRAA
jgi:hypothetical protein